MAKRPTTALIGIDSAEIKELAEFLEPFDCASARREKSSNVTSGKVPSLIKHLEQADADSMCMMDISALKQQGMQEVIIMEAVSTIERCKVVVAYLKRAGHNKLLETSAKQEVETRWNSQLTMLNSLHKQWVKVRIKTRPTLHTRRHAFKLCIIFNLYLILVSG